jgi:hypothetical protein
MQSRQPTRHGYAVNVKDDGRWTLDVGPLSEGQVQALYDARVEEFWMFAQDIARDYGFQGAFSVGHMGGWCQPYPQPADDVTDDELEAWERERFRPFERDALSVMEGLREDFLQDVEDAREAAEREPTEAAYWAACDVVTVA